MNGDGPSCRRNPLLAASFDDISENVPVGG
jgi:hypothetical protein